MLTEPGSTRVLVAGSDTPATEALLATLAELGYDVVGCAPDSVTTVQQAGTLHPDVVILAAHLAGPEGIETARRLVDLWPSSVVLLAAEARTHPTVPETEAGVCAVLPAHPTPRQLDRAVTSAATLARWSRERLPRACAPDSEVATPGHRVDTGTVLPVALDGACFVDRTGRILEVNEPLCDLLGSSRENLLGLPLQSLAVEGAGDRLDERLRALLEQGAGRFRAAFGRGSGQPVEVEGSVGFIPAEDRALVFLRAASERWRADDVQRPDEEKYRRLVETTDTGFVILSREGTVVDANPRYVSLTGHASLSEIQGRCVVEWTAEHDRERNAKAVEKCLSQGFIRNLTVDYRDPAGRIIPIEINATVVGSGPGTRILTLCRDVSERQRAQAALRQSEERNRALLEAIPDMMFLLDAHGVFLDYRCSEHDLLYAPPELFLGRHISEVLPAEVAEATLRHMRETTASGGVAVFEYTLDFGGTPHHFEARVTASWPDNSLSIVRDITERKRAEDALRAERSLFVGGPVVVFRWKAQEGWPVEYVSPNVEPLFGHRADDLTSGRVPYASIVHPDDLMRVAEEVTTYSASGAQSFEQEYRLAGREGEFRWVHDFTTVERDSAGRITHYRGYILDMTDRKQAEDQLLTTRQQLSDIIEFLPDATFVIDRDKKVIAWNRALHEMTGTRKEDILGQGDYAYAVPWYGERRPILIDFIGEEHSEFLSRYDYVERMGDTLYAEVFVPSVFGGRGADLRATASPLFDSEGNRVGAIESVRDITERKRAERVQAALHRISEAAHDTTDLGELLAHVHAAVSQLMPAANFYVALHDREKDELSFPYHVDEHDPPPAPRRSGTGLTEHVLRSGKPLRASRGALAELEEAGSIALVGTPSVEWLGVPLTTGGRTIGVLAVQSYSERVLYSDRDTGLLEIVANQVAAAIERTRAEQALRDSEERYRQLVELSPDAIAVHAQGRVVFVNPACVTLLGAQGSAEMLGKPLLDFVDREFRDLVRQRVRTMQVERLSVPLREERFVRLDGTPIDVEVAAGPFTFQGQPAILVAFRDISGRKAAEQEASRVRQYLKSIIDSMPSLIAGVDLQGRITEWNAQAEIRTGIPAEDAMGRPLDAAVPWLATLMESVRLAIRTATPRRAEKVLHHAKGATQYADVMIYPLAADGVTGAVVRVDDVTQRVRMEQMMVQTEKIMAVGGIAAGVAHEINNPLGGILQGAQNISRRLSIELPRNAQVAAECGTSLEAIQAYAERRGIWMLLDGIRESGERAARIVSDMLQFSRPSQLTPSPTDLALCLDKMVALAATDYDLKKRYDFRSIEVVRDYDRELGEVLCIPTQVELVFLNLLKNAAQAMHEGQRHLAGATPRITLRTRLEGAMARVEVEDNGPGMDEATRKRIFEPFFTTKEPGTGTGLGLSVSCFIIADLHRGEITVDSSPGQGARFVIRIPRDGRQL